MRNIAVVTGTRAEYGLLKHIMYAIRDEESLNLQLIVTGTHLSERYGMTINEIINDGFKIDITCPILLDYTGKDKNVREIAIAINEFSNAFNRLNPDIVLILGDRYEAFAAATTAMAMNIPIAHVAGGEITEGAMDEQIRHSITKMAHIHFVGTEIYGQNVRNMGEESWRVFNVGDSGIENIKLTQLMSKKQIEEDLDVTIDDDTILATYHPVTLEQDQVEMQITNVLKALEITNKKVIFTYPNADNGGDKIIKALNEYQTTHSNIYLFKNLGSLRYLSVMNYCGLVLGNSSSALIEAPFLKKAVVNIGNRQKGRLMADNIIQADYSVESIVNSINKGMSLEFRQQVKQTISLYGEGNTSQEIVDVLKNIVIDEKLLKKKLTWSEK